MGRREICGELLRHHTTISVVQLVHGGETAEPAGEPLHAQAGHHITIGILDRIQRPEIVNSTITPTVGNWLRTAAPRSEEVPAEPERVRDQQFASCD